MNTKNNTLKVYVDDKMAGLLVNHDGKFSFQYTTIDTPPLSITMPARTAPYADSIAKDFFSNFLPEGKAREFITKQLKLPSEDDFALLRAIGRECAGAVSLIPYDEQYSSDYSYELIDEEKLYEVISNLPMYPAVGKSMVKLSLAGAQSKLALLVDGEGYKLPLNGSPS